MQIALSKTRAAFSRGSGPGADGSGAVPLQEQHARRRAAAGGHDRRGRVGDLALAGVVAELRDRIVEEAEPVRAAFGELAAVGVHRELAVEGDPPPTVQPVVGLADPAEAQAL